MNENDYDDGALVYEEAKSDSSTTEYGVVHLIRHHHHKRLSCTI